jgi:hypothetical protein
MAERWALNASPLIVLARVGLEHLPLSLADQVVVPRQVAEEIQAGPAQTRPGRLWRLASSRSWMSRPHHPSYWPGTLEMVRQQSSRGPSPKKGGQPY